MTQLLSIQKTRHKAQSVAVLLRQFTGFCAPAPSGVSCQTVVASGTVYSSATDAGKRTVFRPAYSNSSPRTQTCQSSAQSDGSPQLYPKHRLAGGTPPHKLGLHFLCKIVYILSGRCPLLRLRCHSSGSSKSNSPEASGGTSYVCT